MAVFVAAGLVAAKLADDARRLHALAMTDDLTGLHNLRSFELSLPKMVRTADAALYNAKNGGRNRVSAA
jgi:PleD family two-component response regulator